MRPWTTDNRRAELPNDAIARNVDDVATTFAFEINDAIVAAGMKRSEVSVIAGHDKGWVSRQLYRGRNLRLRNMARLAYAAGFRLKITLEKRRCESK